jgi:phosphoesterase RecJ-like protein
MSMNKIIKYIKTHKAFLITAHRGLEGDALGSQLSFYNLLKKLGKSAVMVDHDAVPRSYSWLPGARLIKRYCRGMRLKFDALVMLDCSDKYRCGRVVDLASEGQPVVNIDHHISNTKFGDINWVLPEASSVSEMIYRLYKAMRVKLDAHTATLIYVGIMTDTGSFRYRNTSSFTHQIAAELLRFNLDASQIYHNIYETISFSDMSLLSKALLTLRSHAGGRIISFQIRQGLIKKERIDFDLTENVLHFGRLVRGSLACVLFKELAGRPGQRQVRVNLRSQGRVDVNRVAQYFAGGGHKTAAGCTVAGRLEEVQRRVIKKIKEQL